ncbi:hypothetical protein ACSTS3_07960 [Aquimarina muelleri]|uniref:hypothetical protein n=1 Tax=Aquimarina muelleri TaxID=279356 RepID=UPI003F686C42
MKSDRIEKIVNMLIDNKITAYEVAQNTSLTAFAVQKIKDRESKNPRTSSLDEIEVFLQNKFSIKNNSQLNNTNISKLAIDVYKNWDELMKEDIFKEKIQNLVKDELIIKLQEMINNKKP